MPVGQTETLLQAIKGMRAKKDKQLAGIRLKDALEKRRLDQALNAKEFAVVAGISYSTARAWFQLPGFPVFQGVVFWQDFVQWRIQRLKGVESIEHNHIRRPCDAVKPHLANLPERARRILREAGLLPLS